MQDAIALDVQILVMEDVKVDVTETAKEAAEAAEAVPEIVVQPPA